VRLPLEGRVAIDSVRSPRDFNDLCAASQRRVARKRETEQRPVHQYFCRHSPMPCVLLDANGSVLFANAEAQDRLGLPAGDSRDGKPLALLLGNDSPLRAMVETAYAAGTEVRDVALDLTADEEPNRLIVSIFSLGQGPEPPGLLGSSARSRIDARSWRCGGLFRSPGATLVV